MVRVSNEHIASQMNEFVCPKRAAIEIEGPSCVALTLGRVFASDHQIKIAVNTDGAVLLLARCAQRKWQRKFIILCTQKARSIRIELNGGIIDKEPTATAVAAVAATLRSLLAVVANLWQYDTCMGCGMCGRRHPAVIGHENVRENDTRHR